MDVILGETMKKELLKKIDENESAFNLCVQDLGSKIDELELKLDSHIESQEATDASWQNLLAKFKAIQDAALAHDWKF